MNSIRRYYDDVLWCGFTHWHPEFFDHHNKIQDKIQQDLNDSGITYTEFNRSKLLLSFLDEGHDHSTLTPLARYFDQVHGRDRYIMMASPYVDTTQYPIFGFTESMVNHGDFLENIKKHAPQASEVLDKKFLCLVRRVGPSRAEFASLLRQRLTDSDLRMSFGSNHLVDELTQYQHLFPGAKLPILLDGAVLNDQREKIYDVDSKWYCSLFNIVVETSSQHDFDIWRSIFITEKTFKAFAMCQIPVWFAVPGLVQQVRNLGFDLFDDIVDHSYDSILNQSVRIQSVVNNVAYLNQKYSLDQCQNLRFSLWDRLQANYKLLSRLQQSYSDRLRSTINNFIFYENQSSTHIR